MTMLKIRPTLLISQWFLIVGLLMPVLLLGWIGCDQQKPKELSAGSEQNSNYPSEIPDSSTESGNNEPPEFSIADQEKFLAEMDSFIGNQISGKWNHYASLPDWLLNDCPFDIQSYLAPSRSGKARDLYFESAFRLNPRDYWYLVRGDYDSDENWPSGLKQLSDLQQKRGNVWYAYLLSKKPIETERDIDEFSQFLASYENVVRCVRNSQAISSPKLSISYKYNGLDFLSMYPRSYADLLELRSKKGNPFSEAIPDLKSGLLISQDFAPLSTYIGHLSSVRSEAACFREVAIPLLAKISQVKELDQLIEVIHNHVLANNRLNRFLESTRQEYLMLRNLLHECENDTFQLSNDELEWLSPPEDTPPMILAQKVLVNFEFYPANEIELEKAIQIAADAKSTSTESIRDIMEDAKKPYDTGQLDANLLLPLFASSTAYMNQKEYDFEAQILRQRCIDVEAACGTEYPARIQKMLDLEKSWTVDSNWQNTKFLKWFQPRDKLTPAEVRSDLISRAILCLASIRKWKLCHDEKLPIAMKAALEFSGIDPNLALDPLTGKPFKILRSLDCAIYSIGPDGVDDRGQQQDVGYLSINPKNKGDLVFDLNDYSDEY
ncbi:MAG: hypothetical protein AAF939_10190 [Planctomycetota bacterium]